MDWPRKHVYGFVGRRTDEHLLSLRCKHCRAFTGLSLWQCAEMPWSMAMCEVGGPLTLWEFFAWFVRWPRGLNCAEAA